MLKISGRAVSAVSLSSNPDRTARRTRELMLHRIGADDKLPALGSLVLRVVQLASADGEAVHNLANFILSDVALTQNILRLANTIGYRPVGGKQITTISKAIFVLGFETIKTTALALVLVDGMGGARGHSVRAELAHALAASAVAREMAHRSQLYRDVEEVAVVALFKNIAKILVASYDHEAYEMIDQLIQKGGNPAKSATQVMGCTYESLTDAILREWKIPDTIVQAVTPLSTATLRQAKTRQEWMQQVASFSESTAALVLTPPSSSGRETRRSLLSQYGAGLHIDQHALDELIHSAMREARIVTGSLDLISIAHGAPNGAPVSEADDQTDEHRGSLYGLPQEFIMTTATVNKAAVIERFPSGKPINAREFLLNGVQDVVEMMASSRCKLNDLIMLVLETLYYSLGCRFATICLRDAKAGQFRARISVGEKQEERKKGFFFSQSAHGDIFSIAMENDIDLLITNTQEEKIYELIPEWHRTLLPDARSFIVLPLVVRNKPVGFFYADRRRTADEGVPVDEASLIKTLKGQVLVALNSHAQ